MHYIPVVVLSFCLGCSYYYGFTPLLLPLLFFVISILTYYLYARDKSATEEFEWRISERRLHIHSLLFGWPGAIVAQQRLRHKTRKVSFRIVFWLTVMANLSAIGWAHTERGNRIVYNNVVKLENMLLTNISDRSMSAVVRFFTGFNRKRFGYIHKS